MEFVMMILASGLIHILQFQLGSIKFSITAENWLGYEGIRAFSPHLHWITLWGMTSIAETCDPDV